MPSAGDSPLARFVDAIVHATGFALGSPRLSDDGSTVTVPILRTDAPRRRYALVSEMAEFVSAEDIGRIDRLRVRNDSEGFVFFPPGTVFTGRETTSRGTTAGVLLAPSTSQDLEVRCLDPSRPVVPGSVLTVSESLAPLDVTQSLLTRDQGLVWATVRPDDDSRVSAAPPEPNRECGRILLDAQGLVAVEAYSHPPSWLAAGARPQGPSAANPLGLNPKNAVSLAQQFLTQLASASLRSAGPSSWVAVDASAALTLMDDEVIHLVAFGRNLTGSSVGGTAEVVAAGRPADVSHGAAPSGSSSEGLDSDVAVAARPSLDLMEEAPPSILAAPPRRRKILTTGWDATTFSSLERLSRKEFDGDRSAAIRALVRRGLWDGGYLGPRSLPPMTPPSSTELDDVASAPGPSPTALEARIREYERIADTEAYADWLRKRARFEIERLRGRTDGLHLEEVPRPGASMTPETGEEAPEPEEIEPEAPVSPPFPPMDVRPLLRRAFAASAAGRYPEALTLFDEVLRAEPDNRTALLGRAVALRRSGKAQEALDALDAVLRVDPSNAAALLNRGRLLQERGDLKAALEAFDLLSRVAPNDWDVWLVRGDVLAKLGRRPEAHQAYAEALRRNPDDESLQLRIRSLENAESSQAPPPAPRIPLPRDVQEGQSYLVREGRPSLSLRVLRALAARGVPALAISPRAPETVRRDVGIVGVRVLELTHTPGEDRHDPTALAALSHTVSRFLQEGRGHGVIALDGLGGLVLENGSRETLLFIERVHEAVLQSHAVFLVSVAPGELSDREIALLERSLRTLS